MHPGDRTTIQVVGKLVMQMILGETSSFDGVFAALKGVMLESAQCLGISCAPPLRATMPAT